MVRGKGQNWQRRVAMAARSRQLKLISVTNLEEVTLVPLFRRKLVALSNEKLVKENLVVIVAAGECSGSASPEAKGQSVSLARGLEGVECVRLVGACRVDEQE